MRQRGAGLDFLQPHTGLPQLFDQLQMLGIGKIANDAFGNPRTDIGDLHQLIHGSRCHRIDLAVSPGQRSCHLGADEPDSQREQQPGQACFFAGLNGIDQITGRFFAHPFQLRQFVDRQFIKVRRIGNQPCRQQRLDDRRAQSVNIHRIARNKVDQSFAGHRRTGGIDAAVRRLAFPADDRFATLGTLARHDEFGFCASAFFGQHRHHFRDHFPGLVNNHRIADPHVFFTDKIFIVKSGPADGRTGDKNRPQDGGRSQHAGPPDADKNIFHDCNRLFGGKFPGDRPARLFGRVAEFFLQPQVIHLDYQSVNFIIQFAAFVRPTGAVVDDRLDIRKNPLFPVGVEAGPGQFFQHLGMGLHWQGLSLPQCIGKKVQCPSGGDFGVELPE